MPKETAIPAPAAAQPLIVEADFFHQNLPSGVELAVDRLPERNTVALAFRMLSGAADDPMELGGLAAIVERTLSKGTKRHDGRGLADAFDAIGAAWSTTTGRQSTVMRVLCLPEFVPQALELSAEMLTQPTFPDDACRVAVELAQQELKNLEDSPDSLVRVLSQKLTYGDLFGRYVGGEAETLARITPDKVRDHWKRMFTAGRLQISIAGAVDAEAVAALVDRLFNGLGRREPAGRQPADFEFRPARSHRHKDLEQEYIAITLPGASRSDPDFAVEQVALGVLSGGMSGRLFTEVREKLGLVYWVGAWHEQPRGRGIINLGASTTPERSHKTYQTLMRELRRLSEDLTEAEVARARDQHIAHKETEDDLTRARAGNLSDDLFHFSRPIQPQVELDAIRAVDAARVEAYVRKLPRDRVCVATLGKREL
ncbi:Peptidase M16 inactive domain protein [Phycisphaerae bacterium RAS1]|nr:Peptidase M16 inactive domain protein [Phycisphaerae bacterium RAS1]